MGKLLFVNTNRVNGIVGLIVSAAAVMVGLWAASVGKYGGLVIVPLGLFGGWFCLKMATQRTELYEQGFVSNSIFGGLSARYADLKSILRGATLTNGVLQTNIIFTTQQGKTVTISNQKFLKGDDKMQMLLDCSCNALAETWAKTLGRKTEVVWLQRGSSALLKIRKEGVLVEGKPGAEALIPLNQFNIKDGYGLDAQIRSGDKKVMTVSSAEPNFYVGCALLDMLARNSQSLAASTHN